MTHFINCYGNIQAEITRLNITNNNALLAEQHEKLFSPQQQASLKMKILSSLNKTYLSNFTEYQNVEKGLIQINGTYDKQFKFGYEIFFKIQFHYHAHQIVIFGTLLKNCLPFRVFNKNHRLTINKFILKVNQGYKIGSLRLNPINGQFSACHNCVFSALQFEHIFEHKKLTEYLENQFKKIEFFLNFFFYLILQMINQIPQNYSRSPQLQNSKIRVLNNSFRQIQELIRKTTPTMHLQFPFMFSDNANYSGSNIVQARQMLQMSAAINTVKRLSKPIYRDVTNVIRLLSDKKLIGPSEDNFSEKQKGDFASRLMQPILRGMQGQNLNIKEVMGKWEKIDEGGFGIIYKGTVAFKFKQNQGSNDQMNKMKQKNYIIKQLVKKEDLEASGKKLNHEKAILSKLKNYSSLFVAKYYYSEQPEFKNCLFIEYCKQKSLAILRSIHFQFLSLQSKLILLKNIAQGIKFLKDHEICHLDIKPTNVLIGYGGAKLIDFGQSFHSGLVSSNHRPGTSIPYAPPQSFSPYPISFNSKMDVFSFGVLMYELLYECYPFDYTRNKYDMFKKMYGVKEYANLLWFAPQRTQRQGFCRIHNILKYVSFRCLEREERQRPCIEWLIIILHYCILLQSSLYR